MTGFRPAGKMGSDIGAAGIRPLMTGRTLIVGEAVVELHSKSSEACLSFFFFFFFFFQESAEVAEIAEACTTSASD